MLDLPPSVLPGATACDPAREADPLHVQPTALLLDGEELIGERVPTRKVSSGRDLRHARQAWPDPVPLLVPRDLRSRDRLTDRRASPMLLLAPGLMHLER
jgi:hypothetical protein